MVGQYFRFDSGFKEFKEIIGINKFELNIDAITLKPKYENKSGMLLSKKKKENFLVSNSPFKRRIIQ
jgi:hypothetical protein